MLTGAEHLNRMERSVFSTRAVMDARNDPGLAASIKHDYPYAYPAVTAKMVSVNENFTLWQYYLILTRPTVRRSA
jgi:hypothetical protein